MDFEENARFPSVGELTMFSPILILLTGFGPRLISWGASYMRTRVEPKLKWPKSSPRLHYFYKENVDKSSQDLNLKTSGFSYIFSETSADSPLFVLSSGSKSALMSPTLVAATATMMKVP